jgi:CysZ protein
MFGDFSRALAQIGDRRFRRVLLLGIGLTLGLLIVVTALFSWAVGWLLPDTMTLPLVGEITWVGDFLSWAALGLMLVLSVFLMVPVASAFTGIFLEDVADAVEDRYYPQLPDVPRPGLGETLRDSVNFLGVIVVVNLVALVLYFFVGPLAPALFWAVNGYLLGREYFQMAAMRRIGRDGANRLRRRHAGQIWAAGTLMAVPLSVPILNLVMPILGAATFTHMFHRLNRS